MPADKEHLIKVKVNEFEFAFTADQIAAADVVESEPGAFNLLHQHHSVNARQLQADLHAKNQVIEIDGKRYTIQIKDELDQRLDQMGYTAATERHIKQIKAPMPGLVLQVNVTEGQQVHEGDKLLILVAMKMENSIQVHTNAIIKKIRVEAGAAVEKGQVLVELE